MGFDFVGGLGYRVLGFQLCRCCGSDFPVLAYRDFGEGFHPRQVLRASSSKSETLHLGGAFKALEKY